MPTLHTHWGSERRSCMTAVPSGYTSHQGNPVSRPELQPFRSFKSSRRYVTSGTVPLNYVIAAVAVKIFWLFSVVFLFGCLFISYSYFSLFNNLSAFFVCFNFAFYFGLAHFSLLVSFGLSSFLQFFPSVADELSCSVAFPDAVCCVS